MLQRRTHCYYIITLRYAFLQRYMKVGHSPLLYIHKTVVYILYTTIALYGLSTPISPTRKKEKAEGL